MRWELAGQARERQPVLPVPPGGATNLAAAPAHGEGFPLDPPAQPHLPAGADVPGRILLRAAGGRP